MTKITPILAIKPPSVSPTLIIADAVRRLSCFWSLLHWRLGNARWLIVLTAAAMICSALVYRHYLKLAEVQIVLLTKAQSLRAVELKTRSELVRQSQGAPAVTSKASLERLELPKEDSLKLAPLHRFLQERTMRGIQLKQVDYQWDKDQGLQSKQRAVRKVDVIISLDASYPALREWLGVLLVQTPNAQLTNLQIQRVSKEEPLTNCLVTVSVYFQGLI